jgi:hypothetical protein
VKQFTVEQIVIGRSEDSQLRLDSDLISPVHAVIEERDSGYYISDLGSDTGTLKNGQKIFDELITSGDELVLGTYKIEFFVGVPKPTQAPKVKDDVVPLKKQIEDEAPPAPPTPPPKKGEITKSETGKKFVSTVEAPKPAGSSTANAYLAGLNERYRKSRGTVLEVAIVWRDRVISTHHFHEKQEVTMGSDESNHIVLPLLGLNRSKMTLLKLDQGVTVFVTPEMTGDYFREEEQLSLADLKRKNRMRPSSAGYEFDIVPGETLRLGLHGDLLSVYVRYVQETPAPLMGPLFDMTASESTAVLMSFVIAALIGLYMLIYTPKPPEADLAKEEPLRRATITFNAPKPAVVDVAEETVQEKKIVKVDVAQQQRTTTKQDAGRVAELRPSPTKKKTQVVSSGVQQGASLKTGKEGASAQSQTRDVTKLGMLGAFGGKGTQSQLSKAYSGTGELLGDAAKATGYAGSADDRAGENLGGRLKNVGGGGKGSATYGISDVGTQGKGTGTFGAGSAGIGKKGRVDLNIGEAEAEFSGSIDREAIRRVIRENIKLFENCYNQALRRNSDAYGKVEIKWFIEERGRATNSVVKSNTVGDKQMGDCLARVIRGLTFPEPPPDQIAEVTYPFVFAAQ